MAVAAGAGGPGGAGGGWNAPLVVVGEVEAEAGERGRVWDLGEED